MSDNGSARCCAALPPSATSCLVQLDLYFLLGAHSQTEKDAGKDSIAEDWKEGRRPRGKKRERRNMKTTENCSCNNITEREEEQSGAKRNID